MKRRLPQRGGRIIALLAALPAIALSPFWLETRLLGPGDGSALHFPLRAAVWAAYRRFDLPSWNEGIFFGTPLLAAYRPGAFFPLMPLLALLEPFDAFQVLVLASLALAAVITFLYLRRLGAHNVGAYVGALSFSLGPYLMGHISDTATLVAAPVLPLLLLAAESHMNRGTAARATGLAVAFALLFLAGSPEAVRAGLALAAGRVVLGHLLGGRASPPVWMSVVAFVAGALLAAPQILPSLYTASQSGLRTTGLANPPGESLGGLAGLVLRYVSHTPAPALALAAVPLVFTQLPFRVLAVALGACLGLQWGRGPLSAPGALPLVFDLTLAILAGLSLSALWRGRHTSLGRRLRAHFLVAAMASAAALSIAATTAGPLPQALAGAVGVLALAFIAWFMLAENKDPVIAGVFLIPLTASFLLQPYARELLALAPTRGALMEGTTVRQAVDGAMALRRGEPTLALVEQWPSRDDAIDLGYANYGSLTGRRSVNGYDPMVQARVRQAFDDMGSGGAVRGAFFVSDPMRLAFLGVRWVEVPVWGMRAQWRTAPDLSVPLGAGRRRFLFPLTPATAVDVTATLSAASPLQSDVVVAWVDVRLATGRSLRLPLYAGALKTRLTFPARYNVIGVDILRARPDVSITITALALFDRSKGRSTPVSVPAAFLSDTDVFRDALATPSVWLFEVRQRQEPRVVATLRRLPSNEVVLDTMRRLTQAGIAIDKEALVREGDAPRQDPPNARASRVAVVRSTGSRVDLFAQGPGYLVLPQTFEEGWRAGVDDAPVAPFRVNHFQTALPLGPGMHRVALRYTPRGLTAGTILAALTLLALLLWVRSDTFFRRRSEATMVG